MRNGFLGSIAALAAGAGLAWGQGGGMPAMPYPGPVGQYPGQDIRPVVGGSPLITPPVTVAPGQGAGNEGAPGYPPPAPFGINDPSGGGAPAEIDEGRRAPRARSLHSTGCAAGLIAAGWLAQWQPL